MAAFKNQRLAILATTLGLATGIHAHGGDMEKIADGEAMSIEPIVGYYDICGGARAD
jgi:hypothetical protein